LSSTFQQIRLLCGATAVATKQSKQLVRYCCVQVVHFCGTRSNIQWRAQRKKVSFVCCAFCGGL